MGEPPLLMGISVWAAAKNALSYLSGKDAAKLSVPATGEQLLMRMTEYENAQTARNLAQLTR
jgi:xanthine dehydrogenase large subunit